MLSVVGGWRPALVYADKMEEELRRFFSPLEMRCIAFAIGASPTPSMMIAVVAVLGGVVVLLSS